MRQHFNRYNPDFDKVMASANNSYDLKLPADKMDLFVSNKYQILNESVQRLLAADESANENKMLAVLNNSLDGNIYSSRLTGMGFLV